MREDSSDIRGGNRLWRRDEILAGMLRCLPVAVSVAAYGVVFGALAGQAGVSLGEAALMSGLVYAGSAQFVALGLWAVPAPVAALALATLVVNLRYLLMATTLRQVLAGLGRRDAALALFFLADENWAVTMAAGERRAPAAFFLGAGLVVYAAWLAATLAGHALGAALADPLRYGLDFAFPAMFLALAVALGRRRPAPSVWATSAAVAIIVERSFGGTAHILMGGLAGALVAALRHAD